jgi:hypothetical protein
MHFPELRGVKHNTLGLVDQRTPMGDGAARSPSYRLITLRA